MKSTRRELLAAGAAAGAAAYAGVACGGGSAASDGPNVLVIVVDTLRIDHAFGPDAETPYLDELAATGLRFTRFFPEAMPTVPARNSLLSGRRQFPFRGVARPSGSARASGLGAARRRRLGVHERAAARRLVDRLRDR